jgi:hypothetical protein
VCPNSQFLVRWRSVSSGNLHIRYTRTYARARARARALSLSHTHTLTISHSHTHSLSLSLPVCLSQDYLHPRILRHTVHLFPSQNMPHGRVVLMQLPGLGLSFEGALVICGMQSEANNFVKHGHRLSPRTLILVKCQQHQIDALPDVSDIVLSHPSGSTRCR